MKRKAHRSAWVEINLGNLDYNIKQIKKKLEEECEKSGSAVPEIIGVIKADGYGHGALRCAGVLKRNGVNIFAVATIAEAKQLRDAGYMDEEIIVLGLIADELAEDVLQYDITAVVAEYENAASIAEAAQDEGKEARLLIAADTGMGRIGYRPEDPEAVKEVVRISSLDGIKIRGVISHMATADEADKSYSMEQKERFEYFCSELEKAGVDIEFRTLANSASVMEIPSVYYDGVRPGIILYGQYPSHEVDKAQLDIKPLMSVKAEIVQLKSVDSGFAVSYGRRFIAQRPSKIATITLGYADGLPRPYSSQAMVIVKGVYAPIAGNICMDQCMVDVTHVPEVEVGDEVIIMGSDGVNSITADDIADATGTINYEIVCAFGQRLPKVYI